MKIVINNCYGGFGLSDEAIQLYLEKKGLNFWRLKSKHSFSNDTFLLCPPEEYEQLLKEADEAPPSQHRYKECNEVYFSQYNLDRWDPVLVEVVEELGPEANGDYSSLTIVDIPFDGPEGWFIDEYDGVETVREEHRCWT